MAYATISRTPTSNLACQMHSQTDSQSYSPPLDRLGLGWWFATCLLLQAVRMLPARLVCMSVLQLAGALAAVREAELHDRASVYLVSAAGGLLFRQVAKTAMIVHIVGAIVALRRAPNSTRCRHDAAAHVGLAVAIYAPLQLRSVIAAALVAMVAGQACIAVISVGHCGIRWALSKLWRCVQSAFALHLLFAHTVLISIINALNPVVEGIDVRIKHMKLA